MDSPCAPAAAAMSRAARSKARMNSRPMILRFASGSVTPRSAPRNASDASTTRRLDARRRHEVLLDLLGLALAQQPVVDEYAGQPVTDGALDERGRDRGVHAAGQARDRPAAADLLPDPRGLLLDDVHHRPGGPAPGRLEQAAQDLGPCSVCSDLRVELDTVQPARGRLDRGGGRRLGARGDREPGRRGGGRVAVRHPDAEPAAGARLSSRPAGCRHLERGTAVLSGARCARRCRRAPGDQHLDARSRCRAPERPRRTGRGPGARRGGAPSA